MATAINHLIKKLSEYQSDNRINNPFSYDVSENRIRRDNLRQYLVAMTEIHPEYILVSEAPGYAGMTRTGVPFTSERIMATHPFFKTGYSIQNVDSILKEQSASIVWKVFDELRINPLMWPAFPFHPHLPGNRISNRKPLSKERASGQEYLAEIISIFRNPKVIAIGRVAEKSLTELGYVDVAYIRHPANGGANQFRLGLRNLFDQRTS